MILKAKRHRTRTQHVVQTAMVHRWAKSFAILFLLPLLWTGCAGSPTRLIPNLGLPTWTISADGTYVAACVDGSSLWTVSRFAVEHWRLHKERPPTFLERSFQAPGQGDPFGVNRCPTGSQGHAVTRDKPLVIPMAGNRQYVVSSQSRALIRGSDYLDWRRTAGRLKDATFDGDSVWAVGTQTLWGWRSGRTRFSPLALPVPVSSSGPVEIFRDGGAVWVRTQDDMGWPLVIRGNYAGHAGKAGRLPPRSQRVELPLAGYTLTWNGPGHSLTARWGSAEVQRIMNVDALMPVGDGHLVVGVGDTVSFWDCRTPVFRRLALWSFGGKTLRFFLDGEVIYALGQEYGLISGRVPRLGLTQKYTNSYR